MVEQDDGEEQNPNPNRNFNYYDPEFKLHSGITPPTRNIRRRKFRKPYTEQQKKEITAAEGELIKILKGTHEEENIEIMDATDVDLLDNNSNSGMEDNGSPKKVQKVNPIRIKMGVDASPVSNIYSLLAH
jgi:TATA-binding protein-associated factor Taf7